MTELRQARQGKQYRTLNFKVASDVELRTAQLNDHDHLVVPVIALVEGVLWPSNAEAPELALASEFGRFAEGWNGRPIMQGHPKNSNGEPVAANSPELWDTSVVGMMFNSQLDGKKLKSEMWINKDKAGEDLLDRFENGVVEVSTGLFAQTEATDGIFNGEQYSGIWRNIVPDHLAILAAGTEGACSIDDGCGAPRINKGAKSMKAACECEKPGAKVLTKMLKGLQAILGFKVQELSDVDKREALTAALSTEDNQAYFYIAAVFGSDFVYCMYAEGSMKMYKRKYSVAEGGAIILSKDVTEVRAETDFVPVSVSIQEQSSHPQGADTMTQAEKDAKTLADKQIADTAAATALTTKANEAREYLKANTKDFDPKQLEGKSDLDVIELAAVAKGLAADEAKKIADKKAVDDDAAAAVAAATIDPTKTNAAVTTADYIKAAPPEIRASLERAAADYTTRKEMLVKALKGKTDLTDAQLNAMEPGVLEGICKAAKVEGVSYAGASPANLSAVKDNTAFTPIQEAFPRKAA